MIYAPHLNISFLIVVITQAQGTMMAMGAKITNGLNSEMLPCSPEKFCTPLDCTVHRNVTPEKDQA